MRAVIIASGEISDDLWLKNSIHPEDTVICADGGYNHLARIGVEPDVLIGDMDSIHEEHRASCQHLVYPRKKDETDTQLALDYAIGQGHKEICFLGAAGGPRLDHELANIFTLIYAAAQDVHMVIQTEVSTISFCQGPAQVELHGKRGDLVSLIPVGGDASGITTHHLEYPLLQGVLKFGVPMGISNVMLETECSVELQRGMLLVIVTKADGVDEL